MKPNRKQSELRVAARRRVALHGSLSDEGQTFIVPCVIRDASKNGLKIYCLQECELPSCVLLKHERLAVPIRAEVRWRDGKWAGLQISWEDSPQAPTQPAR